ncbi:hypothetical protein Zm00014a_012430 [Zea mays]|uniref:Uncharacterized protein n=1 Tax=Zea mays TaxID=4577 RepID=A0A317YIA7_MAIZE|nr:hypothetical protein Zm00014a_012430 [Zea mays]
MSGGSCCKTFAIPCGYAVEGLGFYFIPQPIPVNQRQGGCNGTVSIVEGSMNEEQILNELKRLVAADWDWCVKCVGNNVFSTCFPSRGELHRMIEWGTVHTKFGAQMLVKEEGFGEEIKYEMPKAWVQFTGLPKELREYSVIWAVGSMLGISKEVDMLFTRKFDRARLKVAVLDPNLIPLVVDVVIGDYLYELKFRVESAADGDQPLPMDMDHIGDNDDDEFQDQNKDHNIGERGNKGASLKGTSKDSAGAVNKVSDSMLNSNTTSGKSMCAGPTQLDLGQSQGTSLSVNAVSIEKLGSIPEALTGKVQALRRSSRRSDSVSEDSLVRAIRLKAGYNLDDQPTKGNNVSFISLPDNYILDSFKNIGILAGSNPSSVASSIGQLKKLEINRVQDQLVGKNKADLPDFMGKGIVEDEEFGHFILNHLCGDIMHEETDGTDGLIKSVCTKPSSQGSLCSKKKGRA